MSASTLERTARPRQSRTRSRTVNARPALALSTLKPQQYDMRPVCASLVCPDCETWVPITGLGTKKPKLVPHDTSRAFESAAVRCRLGSNRLITVDVTVRAWQERLEGGHAETVHRRRTTVRRKPKVAVAPAVSQIAARKQTPTVDQPGNGRREWQPRKAQWAATESAVRDADTRRAKLPAGATPLGAPSVPLTTLHPERRAS
ncbi:hypothetical protein GCM10023347_07600 [Streptomyces chumphonensis]|uniref:Uncharacterized protein n=1 Tax=Streptomyces chumphonensis TaxID=1214925 RepID=A0A927F4H4_9ACTN|nr:hypothetical protein [Streptomyces chumphonensis]MBD3934850.1 hypothetical protein [Streptomyces chumphonensis]